MPSGNCGTGGAAAVKWRWLERPRALHTNTSRWALKTKGVWACSQGVLTLDQGYTWNGCNIPFSGGLGSHWVLASAVHDALYALHVLDRHLADRYFISMVKAPWTYPVIRAGGTVGWNHIDPWFQTSVDTFARWEARG